MVASPPLLPPGRWYGRHPASLLVRLRGGADEEAWKRFVLLFAPLLDRWARGLGARAADADDLVQDVFCILVRRLPRFHYDPAKSFRAWLWTTLHHCWLDRRARRAERPMGSGEAFDRADPAVVTGAEEAEYRTYLVNRAAQILQRDFEPTTWRVFWELVVSGRPRRRSPGSSASRSTRPTWLGRGC